MNANEKYKQHRSRCAACRKVDAGEGGARCAEGRDLSLLAHKELHASSGPEEVVLHHTKGLPRLSELEEIAFNTRKGSPDYLQLGRAAIALLLYRLGPDLAERVFPEEDS